MFFKVITCGVAHDCEECFPKQVKPREKAVTWTHRALSQQHGLGIGGKVYYHINCFVKRYGDTLSEDEINALKWR